LNAEITARASNRIYDSTSMNHATVDYDSTRNNKELNNLLTLISSNNIVRYINCLSSFHNRHSKSNNINLVASWLKEELIGFGYEKVFFHHYEEEGYQLKNVICHKEGKNKINKKIFLICAHYDCISEDIDNMIDKAPGANDNASGVSAILEIARILSSVELENSLQFVFFSGEEQGQWGSKHYAQYIRKNNINLYRLINLDMISSPPENSKRLIIEVDRENKLPSQKFESISFGETLKQMAMNYTDLEVVFDNICNSDYMPFQSLGYVVTGLYDGGCNDPTNHSKDDVQQKVNLNYLISSIKVVIGTIFTEASIIT